MMNREIQLAQVIWDYMLMNQKVGKADVILALGSHDIRVAERAAELYNQGFAPMIIFSGGIGLLTKDEFDNPEAEVFADRAVGLGVPRDKIIIENKSTNTGDNFIFTKKLLEEKNLLFPKMIVVQKPYMERRTWATMKKVWPLQEAIVTSPQQSFEDYSNGHYDKEKLINIMVGDVQRIIKYPKKGFQISQEVPDKVLDAYNKLINFGYTERLIEAGKEKK
jgi:uncharacterized SAM-binding protein YcdF (DUF218 family)